MSKRLLIIGAGGHGKVAADCAESMEIFEQIAFLDGEFPQLRQVAKWPVIGDGKDLALDSGFDTAFFVAIGDNRTRQKLLSALFAKSCEVATLIHPSAVISKYAQIAEGSLVCANAVINVDTKIGRGCIINTSATVDHDCQVEDYVHLAPGTRLAGTIKIGTGSFTGIGSVIISGKLVGKFCTLGAGSTLLNDLSDFSVAVGTPAKVIKKNEN
ncbi:MAG: UDP-N-acetylbacillosamine N-acetyltransferase [Paraglaciecola sp.]